jgi:SDR family mycofactocin-dependent oxidoreductase
VEGLAGKVAFITGVARGQGRAHAIRLAREGVDIIGVDCCCDVSSTLYPLATPDDLAETVRRVEAEGQRITATVVDVRDRDGLERAVDAGVKSFGGLDLIIANAGIWPKAPDVGMRGWHEAIDIMTTGTFNTLDIAVPAIVQRGAGGSVVLTSSSAGLRAPHNRFDDLTPGKTAYAVAKHALIGLMRVYASALAEHSIRVNTIHPTRVNTTMMTGSNPDLAGYMDRSVPCALPVQFLEPEDVADAVAWLCSDGGRYITGTTFVIDAGMGLH